MLPHESTPDAANVVVTDTVLDSNDGVRSSVGSNCAYVVFSQSSAAMRYTVCMATFCYCIVLVVLVRSKEQVFRIATRWIVAMVAANHSCRNLSIDNLPCDAMNLSAFSTDGHQTIPFAALWSCPNEALIKRKITATKNLVARTFCFAFHETSAAVIDCLPVSRSAERRWLQPLVPA